MALLLIAPFISIYGKELSGHTPALIGLSLGIYGLTQGLLQTPFGSWSDRFGRKKLVLAGLFLLMAGMVMAAFVTNIYLFIIARALQGSGAISAVTFSWIGDRIHSDKRDRAASFVGLFIGVDAMIGLAGGPFLFGIMSMPQIFSLCAVLVLLSIMYILLFIRGDHMKPDHHTTLREFLELIKNKTMLKLAVAGFSINYIMLGTIFIVPLILEKYMDPSQFWKIFLPTIIIGLIVMRISSRFTDKGYFINTMTILFTIILTGSFLLFWENIYTASLSIILIIICFVSLITILPANVTKLSQRETRGKLTGFFNTIHVVGEFAGASLTGALWGIYNELAVIIFIILSVLSIFSLRKVDVKHFYKNSKPSSI